MSERGSNPGEGPATLRPPHSARGSDIAFDKLIPSLRTPVSVPLGRLEMTVFTRIDGRRSVLDIAQEIGLSPFEVLRMLERIEQLVPALRLGESEVVELSVDDLWEEEGGSTGEQPVKRR